MINTLVAHETVVKVGFAQWHEEEPILEDQDEKISAVMITTNSLDSAAAKARISREKYFASRQQFLRSYKLTKEESVGRKIKVWFKNNKPQNPIRFVILCMAKPYVRD
ncbi:hypothetical protein L484_004301 [Morus notabilis]|uniref:Uncharacterized protein n=1 Tax=Morus notabilis TaxID=981085 RepID=W9R5L8_9ROSA|nr:hypothetical protein L484_004301 [Morus notabilis]